MTDIAALHEPFAKAPIGRIPVSGRGAIPKKKLSQNKRLIIPLRADVPGSHHCPTENRASLSYFECKTLKIGYNKDDLMGSRNFGPRYVECTGDGGDVRNNEGLHFLHVGLP